MHWAVSSESSAEQSPPAVSGKPSPNLTIIGSISRWLFVILAEENHDSILIRVPNDAPAIGYEMNQCAHAIWFNHFFSFLHLWKPLQWFLPFAVCTCWRSSVHPLRSIERVYSKLDSYFLFFFFLFLLLLPSRFLYIINIIIIIFFSSTSRSWYARAYKANWLHAKVDALW